MPMQHHERRHNCHVKPGLAAQLDELAWDLWGAQEYILRFCASRADFSSDRGIKENQAHTFMHMRMGHPARGRQLCWGRPHRMW